MGRRYGDPAVRLIPTWLRRYDRAWLPADAMAGLTIWALMVPQAMAYAGIAGVPVQNGLYVMPLAVVGYALFGSSRHLFVGPSATVATLSASVGGCRRYGEHGLGRVRRPDLCADAHGGRDLRRGRPGPDGLRRPLLRPPGARGLHRRARPLHRDRPAAEGGGNREAVGQHALGAREHDRRRRELGLDHGRRRGRRAGRAVRARSIRAEAPRRDHRRRACGARGPGARPAGPRRGDRRRRADRLSVRLAVERLGERPRRTCSPAPSRL